MALSAGGFITLCLLPLVGKFVAKVAARILIGIGFGISGLAPVSHDGHLSRDRLYAGVAIARISGSGNRIPVCSHPNHFIGWQRTKRQQPGFCNPESCQEPGRQHRNFRRHNSDRSAHSGTSALFSGACRKCGGHFQRPRFLSARSLVPRGLERLWGESTVTSKVVSLIGGTGSGAGIHRNVRDSCNRMSSDDSAGISRPAQYPGQRGTAAH